MLLTPNRGKSLCADNLLQSQEEPIWCRIVLEWLEMQILLDELDQKLGCVRKVPVFRGEAGAISQLGDLPENWITSNNPESKGRGLC